MKKFSVSAILAMGVLTVSSGAFAVRILRPLYRGLVTGSRHRQLPKDTVIPEQTTETGCLALK